MGKPALAKREAPTRPAESRQSTAPENETDASTFQELVTFFQSPAGERLIVLEILIFTVMTLMIFILYQKELKRREEVQIAMDMIRAVIFEIDPISKDKDDYQILDTAQNLSEKMWYYSKKNEQLQEEIDILNKNVADGWILYSEAYYFFSLELRSWMDAKKMCEEQGAKLVSIETDEEQLFINRQVKGRKMLFSIGLFKNKIGRWTWLSGKDPQKTYWNTYWNAPVDEPFYDCAAMTHDCYYERCWTELKCAQLTPYICKKVPNDAWL